MYRLHPFWSARSRNVLSKIYTHSFNQQLCAGTLPRTIFKVYLEQDALYLHDFARALRIISDRFTEGSYAEQFKRLSEGMISAELKLHERHLSKAEPMRFFSQKIHQPIAKIPVIAAYTEHLLYTATNAPIAVAVASCTPCFLIYKTLGELMKVHCHANNPYRDWIASYSGQQFTVSTQRIMQTTHELTSIVACPMLQKQISDSFLQSTIFELMFFEAVHTGHTSQHAYALTLFRNSLP